MQTPEYEVKLDFCVICVTQMSRHNSTSFTVPSFELQIISPINENIATKSHYNETVYSVSKQSVDLSIINSRYVMILS